MADERSVVWVLGAGFSRSLGAPLLKTFFGPHRREDLHTRYPQQSHPKLHGNYINLIAPLYKLGGERGLWEDPEGFLDYLDLAAADPAGWNGDGPPTLTRIVRLARKIHANLEENELLHKIAARLHGAARRLMAAECLAFLEGKDTGLETWQPYWDWVWLVEPRDQIITFNYDLVVETLVEDAPRHGLTSFAADILAPGKSPRDKCAPVLKLHGSVDWKSSADGYALSGDRRHALTCEDDALGIASPGSNKLRASKGGLASLWKLAAHALRHADAVVFLGYRFPPSDAHARSTFVNALAEGFDSKHHVSAHVVLGPNSTDAERTCQILHYAFRRGGRQELPPPRGVGYQVVAQPLSVEDFLTVMSREQLFAPSPHYPTEKRWARLEAQEMDEISKLTGG